jgi:DNA-nicking Smr family endonuclease
VRSLSAEERALWERVAATIRPLSRERVSDFPAAAAAAAEQPRASARVARTPVPPKPSPARPQPRPGTLDSSWDKKLGSGTVDPDRVLDLHGLNLDQAWNAIDVGLDRAIAAGERVLLLITGHARSGEPPVQRGKIRAAVHDWLAASRHSTKIAAVRSAHRRHGGGGSLYIILRRKRAGSTIS